MFHIEFDDRGLKRIEQRLRRLSEDQNVSFAEQFSSSFMKRYTKHPTIDAFMKAAGLDSEEKIRAVFDDPNASSDFDRFVADNSTFASFAEMQKTAAAEYVKKQLGL